MKIKIFVLLIAFLLIISICSIIPQTCKLGYENNSISSINKNEQYCGKIKIEVYPLSGIYKVPIATQSIRDREVLANKYFLKVLVRDNCFGIKVKIFIDNTLWSTFQSSGKELYVLTTAFPQYMRFHLGVHKIKYVIEDSCGHVFVREGKIKVLLVL